MEKVAAAGGVGGAWAAGSRAAGSIQLLYGGSRQACNKPHSHSSQSRRFHRQEGRGMGGKAEVTELMEDKPEDTTDVTSEGE
eukprot:1159162-Pelagomonas_calceolata.AAC.3